MPSLKTAVVSILAVAGRLTSAWPYRPQYAHILERAEQLEEEYDYVIVGGGTSGLTVGDRLSEDGKYTVLVLEHGYFHNQTGMNPARMYNITSEPSPALNDRQFSVGIGWAVGGSSIVNGQVFLRGTKSEYDAWKTLSNDPDSTWDWEGLLPYFKKGITLTPPAEDVAEEFNIKYDTQYWGTETPIYASFGSSPPQDIMKVLYGAMAAMPGLNVPEDSGAGESGLYWYTTSSDPETGVRSSSRTGHWDGIVRDNYELLVGAKVNKILFDDDLGATGVQFVANDTGEAITVSARREVILAAGAIHTPQILMLSGIGPSPLLTEAGIDVKVDLAGVGSNFQDHSYIPNIGFQWGTTPPGGGFGAPPGSPSPPLVAMIPLTAVAPDTYGALATKYEEQDPTTHLPSSYTEEQVEGYRKQQEVYAELMRSDNINVNEIMLYGPGGAIQNLHCHSRGTVFIDPANPEGEMIVDYRAGSNEIDLEVMAENIRFMRRFMTEGELEQYEATETSPGSTVSTMEQLVEWTRERLIPSVYHPVSTAAKMPREWGGVVNEDLQVYGTKKLSIIDASIFPVTVGATTSMTVYAVAEKAADIIKERTSD